MPLPDSLHARFAATAARFGDRVAVGGDGTELTYRDLDARSAKVAAVLTGNLRPGERLVALRTSRGVRTPVGLLAVLRAGAGYVPVDPAYPEERRRYIMDDSRVSLVVADRPAGDGEETVAEVDGMYVIRRTCVTGAPVDVPEDTAYVIYTSGSTSAPKGCVVGHPQVLSLMDATVRHFAFTEDDVWTLFHSTSFDFSVWELWGALLYGGRAVVVQAMQLLDPLDFTDLLLRERVTVLNQVPSVFGNLAAASAAGGTTLPDLRYVVFGGEAVNPADVRLWWESGTAPDCAMVNMYGITETTVHTSFRRLDAEALSGGPASTTPIGLPLDNLRFSLRGEDGRAVADGEPGELWVTGGGTAYGYLDRPGLTAERFVTAEGRRYYRSGDWAVRAGGEYHYIGRRDGQVKLNGHRIELGEVEAVVAAADGVRQCVCTVDRDPLGGSILTAHVTAGHGRRIDVDAIRAYAASRLPAYMCTMRFEAHESLPLTDNGKVDRRALRAAVAAR